MVQVMSALAKCKVSAATCNLINTGKREDLYGDILSKLKGVSIDRQTIKEAIIPMLYGSKAKPKELFGEGTDELKEFLRAVHATCPVLADMRSMCDAVWNKKALYHSFTLPDGHRVILPSSQMVSKRIEIKGTSYTYQYKEVAPDSNSTPLLAHITHAVDGYVAREMVRRANKQGFQLAHIHDSFWASPVYMNRVRYNFISIMVEIAQSNLLEDILSEIKGSKVSIEFDDTSLWKDIMDSEYGLS